MLEMENIMVRISNITIKEYPQHYFVAIRKNIDFMKEFSLFSETSLHSIQEYLNKQNRVIMDGPMVYFHNMDLENLDVEVGFPVLEVVEVDSEIAIKQINKQKVVTAIDLGKYEDQDPTLEDLFGFIQEHHLKPQGAIIYQYLNETEQSSNHYLTKMMIPID